MIVGLLAALIKGKYIDTNRSLNLKPFIYQNRLVKRVRLCTGIGKFSV
jgi:hypothetical protein